MNLSRWFWCGLPLAVIGSILAITRLRASEAPESEELKVFAKVSTVGDYGTDVGPIRFSEISQQLVLRSAGELRDHAHVDEGSKSPEAAAQVESSLARLLDVESIDWDRQMIIAIRARPSRTTHEIEVDRMSIAEGVCTVNWRLARKDSMTFNSPKAVLLVERFDGDVRFKPDN